MESDCYPVIIRCKDVSLAMPMKILIQESTLFKMLYESAHQKRPDSTDSGKESGSECSSYQDGQVLQEVEQEEMNIDERIEKEISDIKSNSETENITQDVHIEKALSAQEFEVLDLSNFNPNSVDLVFLGLRGYPQIIASCISLSDLYGALKICDEYGISSPLKDISARFKTCENISMENLISVMEIVEEIEKMKNFKDISDTLLERCVAYARWNFASWQVILKLIAAHKENIHLVQRILKQLRDEPQAILRFKVSEFSKMTDSKTSPSFILSNFEWQVKVSYKDKERKALQIWISCKNPKGEKTWKCETNIQMKIINQKTKENSVCQDVNFTFTGNNQTKTFNDFKELKNDDLIHGVILDDTLVIEAKLDVVFEEGLPESLGIKDSEMGWFDKNVNPDKNDKKNKEIDLKRLEKYAVIFCCEDKIEIVPADILARESVVFNTMFSEPWNRDVKCTENEEDFCKIIKQIKLQNYSSFSVKCLVDHLKGYQPLLDECKDMKVIADVLRLCDYYDIQTLIPKLMSRILNLSVSIRNVMNCYAASKSLIGIEAFKDLSTNLVSKCIFFLRANLASWQVLIHFLVDNSDENKLCVEIVEELACKIAANIRWKSGKISEGMDSLKTVEFIHHNFLWKFSALFETNKDEVCNFGCYLYNVKVKESLKSIPKARFEMELHSNIDAHKLLRMISLHVYKDESGWGNILLKRSDLLDPEKGYIKDGFCHLEFEMEAKGSTDLQSCLRVTEQMIN